MITLTEEQLAELESFLSEGVAPLRREIAGKAYSLVGNVKYFWGGKSLTIGWDARWGNQAVVGSAGSTQTGTVRAFGTDCSGFVLWSMINGFYNADENSPLNREDAGSTQAYVQHIVENVGYGTASQWGNSYEISREEALPGDLLFYNAPGGGGGRNHVGIVIGREADGDLIVCHNSSSRNGVIMEAISEGSSFRHVRRLYLLDELLDEQTE